MSLEDIKKEVVDAKNHDGRNYSRFTSNFYILRSALRYFKVKKNVSFTSSKVAEEFPLPVSTAGSALKVLEDLDIVERRTDSTRKRYMPGDVDLEKLEKVRKVLLENHEIREHH
ncbi:MAG: hypothetical protein ABEJ95_05880 [Candidatus Nanohalobium sp.]